MIWIQILETMDPSSKHCETFAGLGNSDFGQPFMIQWEDLLWNMKYFIDEGKLKHRRGYWSV